MNRWLGWVALLGLVACCVAQASEPLRIATFQVDATPAIGSPVAYALARKIEDPLSARGIVLLGDEKPIVLCAVDWITIANGGYDAWREALALAAGTTADRVAVHTIHQHDGPRCDFSTEELLAARGLAGKCFDAPFARATIDKAAAAVREALKAPKTVTHLGIGQAKVDKVASNRRILGPDGKVMYVRYSSCRDPKIIAAPEGVIDPLVRVLSFWDGSRPLACLSYYATHPQSYYGKGDVTAEFVGLARAARESALPGVVHVHFTGAAGNVAAGKYNDGSPAMRPVLTQRLAEGMRAAWEATQRAPISAADVGWQSRGVKLPLAPHLNREKAVAALDDAQAKPSDRMAAASDLVWIDRVQSGRTLDVSCLRLGKARVLSLPGELFVEYQLAAQAMRPQETVCVAAYGDGGPGYIGTQIAYGQGGYETSPRASNVAPEVEPILLEAIGAVLK